MSNLEYIAKSSYELVTEFSALIREKFFWAAMSTDDFVVEKWCNSICLFVGNGFCFWPFGEVFSNYDNVFVASGSLWQRSNKINSYSFKGLSNFDWVERFFLLSSSKFLAGLTGVDIVSNIYAHFWPIVSSNGALISAFKCKMSSCFSSMHVV